jgi:hypothetical protein
VQQWHAAGHSHLSKTPIFTHRIDAKELEGAGPLQGKEEALAQEQIVAGN